MKRSEINRAWEAASECLARHHWHLPPAPRWDITDFGLGDFARRGLVLVNLAEEPEYCEKLMFARRGQTTPAHTHVRKKEDIVCRVGRLRVRLWPARPDRADLEPSLSVPLDGVPTAVPTGEGVLLEAGRRVTLAPGVWHEFLPESEDCILGEVSTANDDAHDNVFLDPGVGRFPEVVEDEPARVRLLWELA